MSRRPLLTRCAFVFVLGAPLIANAQEGWGNGDNRKSAAEATGEAGDAADVSADTAPTELGTRGAAADGASDETAPVGSAQPKERKRSASKPEEAPATEHHSAGASDTEHRKSDNAPPTLFGSEVAVGGYGGLSAAYTKMGAEHGALVGVEAALLLQHRLSLGLAAYGFTPQLDGPPDDLGRERDLHLGYGGLVLRYALLGGEPVYASVGAVIGGGGGVLALEDHDHHDEDHEIDRDDVDLFFAVEPQVAVHANLTRWMRIGLQGGYRFTAGVAKFGYEEADHDGVTVGSHLQFGWF